MSPRPRPRRLCVVTGTRAEFGLLVWLMREIDGDPDLDLQLVVTGMHLSPEFGLTVREIEAEGFEIDGRVEMLLSSDSPVGVAKSMGLGVIGFADEFARLRPDVVVVLGDRFEVLSAAQAALVARIPIAHIHGGEITEGAFDDSFRHAITKMAQWHFVAAEPYRRRVVQMGEDPDRVFDFGAPGLDALTRMSFLDRGALVRELGMELGHPFFLVTYHPTTLSEKVAADEVDAVLAALDSFPDATIVITHPNADPGGRAVIERIERWVDGRERAKAFASLGRRRYLSALREADVVIGNSSSGLIEAPALKRATVNIGDRQGGRLRASSVLDAPAERDAILGAIGEALSDEFRKALPTTRSLYGWGDSSVRIKDRLKAIPLGVRKSFHDVKIAP